MTRSETLEKAITLSKFNLEWLTKHAVESTSYNEQLEAERLTLNLLLTEQKRCDGCDLCLFDDGTKVTHLILAETCEGDANYCPLCGRDLTDGESV